MSTHSGGAHFSAAAGSFDPAALAQFANFAQFGGSQYEPTNERELYQQSNPIQPTTRVMSSASEKKSQKATAANKQKHSENEAARRNRLRDRFLSLSALLDTELDEEGGFSGSGNGQSRVNVLQTAITTIKDHRAKIAALEAQVARLTANGAAGGSGSGSSASSGSSPMSTAAVAVLAHSHSAGLMTQHHVPQAAQPAQQQPQFTLQQMQAMFAAASAAGGAIPQPLVNQVASPGQVQQMQAQMMAFLAQQMQQQGQQPAQGSFNNDPRASVSAPPVNSAGSPLAFPGQIMPLQVQPHVPYANQSGDITLRERTSSRHSRNNSGSSFMTQSQEATVKMEMQMQMQQHQHQASMQQQSHGQVPSSPGESNAGGMGSRKRSFSSESQGLVNMAGLSMSSQVLHAPSRSRGTSAGELSVDTHALPQGFTGGAQFVQQQGGRGLSRPASLTSMAGGLAGIVVTDHVGSTGPLSGDQKRRRTNDGSASPCSSNSSVSASPCVSAHPSPLIRPRTGSVSPRPSFTFSAGREAAFQNQMLGGGSPRALSPRSIPGLGRSISGGQALPPILQSQGAFLLSLDGQVLEVSDRLVDVLTGTTSSQQGVSVNKDHLVNQSLFSLLHPSESVSTLTSMQTLLKSTGSGSSQGGGSGGSVVGGQTPSDEDVAGTIEDSKRLFLRNPLGLSSGSLPGSSPHGSTTIALRLVLCSVFSQGRLKMLLGLVTPWDNPPTAPHGFQGGSAALLEQLQLQASHLLEPAQMKYVTTVLFGVPKSKLSGGGSGSSVRSARHSLTQPLVLPSMMGVSMNVQQNQGGMSLMRSSGSRENLPSMSQFSPSHNQGSIIHQHQRTPSQTHSLPHSGSGGSGSGVGDTGSFAAMLQAQQQQLQLQQQHLQQLTQQFLVSPQGQLQAGQLISPPLISPPANMLSPLPVFTPIVEQQLAMHYQSHQHQHQQDMMQDHMQVESMSVQPPLPDLPPNTPMDAESSPQLYQSVDVVQPDAFLSASPAQPFSPYSPGIRRDSLPLLSPFLGRKDSTVSTGDAADAASREIEDYTMGQEQ